MKTPPVLTPGADQSEAELKCPCCGSMYLHHGEVLIFDRSREDDKIGAVISVSDGRALTLPLNSAAAGNPSDRRHGLVIRFWCEDCDGHIDLCIAQHKGVTNLWWKTKE